MNEVLTIDELLKANKHLNFEIAAKIKDWATKKYVSLQSRNIDIVEFNNAMLTAIIDDEATYDLSKGTLLKYLQTSMNFEVIRLINATSMVSGHTLDDVVNIVDATEEVHKAMDYTDLSDIEVETLYMVTQGATFSDARLAILKRIKERR